MIFINMLSQPCALFGLTCFLCNISSLFYCFLHEEKGRALTFIVSADIAIKELLRSHAMALKLEINLQATSE